jgi:LmbE family N-acetylglucosaminyl deacetylase
VRLTAVPSRALAVFSHPNDPEVACAGTLAAWAAAGCEARLLIVNSGDKGSDDASVVPEQLARERAEEVASAAGVLGLAGTDMLGVPDGEAQNNRVLRGRIVEVLRRHRPEVVICPDPTSVFFGSAYMNHHDHRAVGWAALDSCAPMAASPLYYPDAGPAHVVEYVLLAGTLTPDCWVDVEATLGKKAAALACHETRLGEVAHELAAELVAARAEEAAAAAAAAGTTGLRAAEGFRRLLLTPGVP